jgi:hypothetical protein
MDEIRGPQLADVYEVLKRHETLLRELKASTEAIKSFLKHDVGDDFGHLKRDLDQELLTSKPTIEDQVRLFDELIAKFRGQ